MNDETKLDQVNDEPMTSSLNEESTSETRQEATKEHNGFVNVMLWLTAVGTSISIFRYAIWSLVGFSFETSLGCGLLALMCDIHLLGIVLVMRWKKVGFYLMAVTFAAAIAVSVLVMDNDALYWVIIPVSIIVWWAILQIRKNGVSTWSQLTAGWDIKRSKDIYIICSAVAVILIILTIFSARRTSYSDDALERYIESRAEEMLSNPSGALKNTQENVDPEEAKRQEAEDFLKSEIEETNKNYPKEIATGVAITEIRVEEDYVVYVAECDEDLVDFDTFISIKDEVKKDLKKKIMADDPWAVPFRTLCTNAHKGIAYRCVGGTSGKSCFIAFPYSELMEQ